MTGRYDLTLIKWQMKKKDHNKKHIHLYRWLDHILVLLVENLFAVKVTVKWFYHLIKINFFSSQYCEDTPGVMDSTSAGFQFRTPQYKRNMVRDWASHDWRLSNTGLQRLLRDWSTSTIRKSWDSCDCLAGGKERSRDFIHVYKYLKDSWEMETGPF